MNRAGRELLTAIWMYLLSSALRSAHSRSSRERASWSAAAMMRVSGSIVLRWRDSW